MGKGEAPHRSTLGGLIHAYQGYDPKHFPSPRQPEPDVAGAAFEHMMAHGSLKRLSPEELAEAVEIDPSQIAGLGPSLERLIAMLEERKRKILATYETTHARRRAREQVADSAARAEAPDELREKFTEAVTREQIRDLERLWFRSERKAPEFAKQLLHTVERMGEQYQVDDLASKYDFTGTTRMDVEKALEVKEELETIDKLLEQLKEAQQNAQVAAIDMDALSEFVEEADVEQLQQLQQQVEDHMREMAERQGLEQDEAGNYRLTPDAYRVFQGKLLEEIFNDLEAARSGRHEGEIVGDGAVELAKTKDYEFGDSAAHMDVPQSFVNALLREGGPREDGGPRVRLKPDDIEVHQTRNNPKCATTVVMDMSGSMRQAGQYIDCKRMALALDGLIRQEYPGDYLQCLEMATVAKPVRIGEVAELMPKPVTIRDPVVRLKADMSRDDVTPEMLPPHFTNVQHALRLSRQLLEPQDTPNSQIILITDGLPTAHFDGPELYMLYPPDPLTEEATLREAHQCAQVGITINVFLLPSMTQDSDDVQFAQRMAESTRGRVFFTGGHDLDRYVLWDYVRQRRKIL